MKFQKYLQDAQRNSGMLRHLNYKALKVEVKRLAEAVESGTSKESAAHSFARQLEAELTEVGCSWEICLWQLRDMVDDLFSTTDMLLRGDAAHGALNELGPLKLLEPLQEFLPVAAVADALRRHRLLQMTAVVKIEKKFVKVVGVQLKPGYRAAELLLRSALASNLIHDLSARLEAAGDTLLRLGLSSEGAPSDRKDNACSICLCELVDPCRLPCSHRFCVHCVLPLFARTDLPEADLDAVHLRCPLCRAAGPDMPQALSLDGLLERLGRGMSADMGTMNDGDSQRFTAVVVSSLARLASRKVSSSDEPPSSIKRSKSIVLGELPECQHLQDWIDASHEEAHASVDCLSCESLTTGESTGLDVS